MKLREVERRSAFSQVCMIARNTAFTCGLLNKEHKIEDRLTQELASIKVPLDVDGSILA